MIQTFVTLFLCIITSVIPQAHADSIENILSKSGLQKVPFAKAKDNGTGPFCVMEDKGTLQVKKKACRRKAVVKMKIDGMEYTGTNAGEFGGELKVKLRNGETEVLIKKNIKHIIRHSEHLYIFTGLDHLGTGQGAVYRIHSFATTPTVEFLTLLPGEPLFVFVKDFKKAVDFHIVAAGGVMTFSPYFELLDIHSIRQFWEWSYPNSAVKEGNSLVLGIRQGVVVITFNHWLAGKRILETSFYAEKK